MRRNLMGWMALCATLLSTTPVGAQDGAAPAAPADGAKPATPAPADAKPADAAPADAKPADAAANPAQPALGPGDRELRKDYPGTEEAMKPRWDGGLATVQDPASDQSYDLRVRELETRIDDLKEKVFRSKSRIVLLEETLLGGKIAGSKAIIVYKNELGITFKLRRALVGLDGNRILNEVDKNDNLADKDTFEIYNGAISPGTHTLTIEFNYQGSGAKVFNYMEGYDLRVPETCKFAVEEGTATIVEIVAFEAGDATTSVENRPDLKCNVSKTGLKASEAKKDGKK